MGGEVTVQGKERVYYSRFQVLTDGEQAWTMDEKGVVYLFDGSCFRRRGHRADAHRMVTSWQSPAYGWMHLPDCACQGCAPETAPEADGAQAVA